MEAKIENKEFLKFETYQIYDLDSDSTRECIVLDANPGAIFVFDTKHEDIILFNLDGELIDHHYENLRLLHDHVKSSTFTPDKYEAQRHYVIDKYRFVRLRNNQIAIITRIDNQLYRFAGYIISPAIMTPATWTVEGFAFADIESDYDIKEVLFKRTITYQ